MSRTSTPALNRRGRSPPSDVRSAKRTLRANGRCDFVRNDEPRCGRGSKSSAKVIDYLNRGLRSELTAVSQYWLHYRLLDNWGLNELAKQWRKESIEEMRHADRFIDRIIFLEGFPNLQLLDPLHIGQSVQEIIESDLKAEHTARSLYQEAAEYCIKTRDYPSRDLFVLLMSNEEGHVDFLETQLDLIKRIGLERYTQAHVGGLGERGTPGLSGEK